ncbi:hypothetical protein WH96_06970 [Kiloniella spongiae]|uniref:Uncharacterized protein n=1 Tax=Kiloniella spongiae TaxID=1489064 RepID=A0A0H2MG79_9PROT|nr:hypothetical protein WH96_06970 [Kiloniella spongiae]
MGYYDIIDLAAASRLIGAIARKSVIISDGSTDHLEHCATKRILWHQNNSEINDVLRIKIQKYKKINHLHKLYVQFFYRK